MALIIFRRQRLRAAAFSIALAVLALVNGLYLAVDNVQTADLALLQGRVIAVDAGHGGIDDGATANRVMEKDVNLSISRKLRDILSSHGAQVIMTRDDDIDYYTRGKGGKRNDLLHRVALINESTAELFVSIHANASKSRVRPGAQVYYSARSDISQQLGKTLQQALQDFPPGNKRQAQEDNEILVLNAPNIPGVLIETGFLSESSEAANLQNSEYQQKMAEMIARGLAYHFGQTVGR